MCQKREKGRARAKKRFWGERDGSSASANVIIGWRMSREELEKTEVPSACTNEEWWWYGGGR